jgi:uncharacterized membrane protein YcaP (DUF421 family)
MFVYLIRSMILYLLLIGTIRLLGKRQLGELDVGELVITILLSDIASLPITNPEKALLDAIIPITILAALEILTSSLILKAPIIKRFLSSKPSVIIARGQINRAAMKKVRISIEDLVSQIRQNGIFDLEEVDYAILEENGKMSIIPKSRHRQPDKAELGLCDSDSGMMHLVISDGTVNSHSLLILQKSEKWLKSVLKKHGCESRDVFCMTCNDADQIYIIKKDGSILKDKGAD